jgi:hypothetical protein
MRRSAPPSLSAILIVLIVLGLIVVLLSGPLTLASFVLDIVVAVILIMLVTWLVP